MPIYGIKWKSVKDTHGSKQDPIFPQNNFKSDSNPETRCIPNRFWYGDLPLR